MMIVTASPMLGAMADGLQPCDSHAAGFVEDLSDDSKGSNASEAITSFLDLPGLSIGWGFQIVHSQDRFLLRSVQFRRDWRGGYVEARPGVFVPNPVQPDRRTFRPGLYAGRCCEIFGVCGAQRWARFCCCSADLFAAEVVAEFDRARGALNEEARTFRRSAFCRLDCRVEHGNLHIHVHDGPTPVNPLTRP